MDREAIKTYSYRISQATRSELVVIVYDIIRDYLKDAVSTSDNAVFKEKLHMAMRGIDQLITGLDMQYELSGNLYVLYNYMKRTLIGAQVSYDKNVVNSIYDMLGQLRQSFYEVSRQDNSAPLMKNPDLHILNMVQAMKQQVIRLLTEDIWYNEHKSAHLKSS